WCRRGWRGACRTRGRWPRSFISWWAGCGPAWATAAPGTSRNCAPAPGSSWSAGRRCRRAILMTSPLRRKRRTTAPARSTWARTLASLAAAGLLLLGGGLAAAQEPAPLPSLPTGPIPTRKISYTKAAAPAWDQDGAIRQVQAVAPRPAAGAVSDQMDFLIQLL